MKMKNLLIEKQEREAQASLFLRDRLCRRPGTHRLQSDLRHVRDFQTRRKVYCSAGSQFPCEYF